LEKQVVPRAWCRAGGVFIPKEKDATSISQFYPISLLNVEGKIFFRFSHHCPEIVNLPIKEWLH